jgi:streptomycin 6-kinase
MKKLIENVKNVFGDKGTAWLQALPTIIDKLAAHWELSHIAPVDNMTFNYVAKAFSSSNQPVVLKISCDAKSIREEEQALLYFDSHASVRLIAYSEKFNAMLLQQAVPGVTLKSFYPEQVEFVMDCYVKTMQELHGKTLPDQHAYRHIRDWLKAIDALTPDQLPPDLLSKAIDLRDSLLATSGKSVFLHGDLHHDNIINNGSEWLAIDAKGIVGESEFEIAAFDFMHASELENKSAIKKIFTERVTAIAKKSNLNPQRIKDWVFVRLIMAAAWSIEDNCDPAWAINLADWIF